MGQYREDLEYIIEHKEIRTVFQPIVSLKDGTILGHEALSRITCESEIENTEMLFTVAGEYNRLWELELLCRTKALEAIYHLNTIPYQKKLFMNVNPNTMHDDNFKKGFTKELLMKYKMEPRNVIFEITERNIISDMKGFKTTIQHYKEQNYEIAIDDAGAGCSGLNLISDVHPNYIKLDMNLIRNINADSLKYALVRGMVELSKVSNILIIAEGIETREELETIINLGVQYGQGYFIQKPAEQLLKIKKEVLQVMEAINHNRKCTSQSCISNTCIKHLCTLTGVISPDESVLRVYDIFKKSPECFGLCVVVNDVPVGIITQEKLALKLSGYYGFTLNYNKPISQVMDIEFLSLDYKTPVNIVSTLAMSRPYDKLYDFVVVTENGQYIGTVTIKDLLQKTTEIEVTVAKHQNPLSGLPGNILIEQTLGNCILNVAKYSVAYLDIDNFKAYNDVYGFENGDLIIKLLADILKQNISNEQFIGHIGGDDFVVILDEHVTQDYFTDMVNQFEKEVLSFYNPTDLMNGYITTANRRGEIEKFPLITLTCVAENNDNYIYKNIYELTERLAGLKKMAKQVKNIF